MNSCPLKSDPRAAQWLADSIDVCKALGLTITMPAFFGNGDLDMNNTAEIDHVVEVLKERRAEGREAGHHHRRWKTTSAPKTTCGSSTASARRP